MSKSISTEIHNFMYGIFSKVKIQGLQNGQNCSFWASKITKSELQQSSQISTLCRRNQSFDLLRISRDVTHYTADFAVKKVITQFSLFVIFPLLFTFSNFVYKTEQLKAHALLALEIFCFDFFSVFENTNKNVNFRCEAQNSLIFTIFTPNQE